jgi:hypothetical protein
MHVLTICALTGALTAAASAAELYIETWDAGTMEGWIVDGSTATADYQPSGGNPDGWVLLANTSSDLIEFISSRDELTGDLAAAGIHRLTVDTRAIGSPEVVVTAKFMTVGDVGLVSGWRCDIVGGLDASWRTNALSFDPTWTDAEAEAHGWFDMPFTAASFSDTMSNVTKAGVQLYGAGVTEVGIDNFGYQHCDADLNGDGAVNVSDLLVLLAGWGQSGLPGDLNNDGTIDVADLLQLLGAWGPCT